MKRIKKICVIALSLFVAVVFSVPTAYAWEMFFEVAGDTPTPGHLDLVFDSTPTDFDLDVYVHIEDSEDNDGLYSAGHKIRFDNALVMDIDATALNTDIWDPAWSVLTVDPGIGADLAISDYWDFNQPWGDLLCETVTFHTTGIEGQSELTMKFFFDGGNFLTWPDFISVDDGCTAFHGATVTVNAVPIPGAAVLLVSGMLGLIGLGRKKIRG